MVAAKRAQERILTSTRSWQHWRRTAWRKSVTAAAMKKQRARMAARAMMWAGKTKQLPCTT